MNEKFADELIAENARLLLNAARHIRRIKEVLDENDALVNKCKELELKLKEKV